MPRSPGQRATREELAALLAAVDQELAQLFVRYCIDFATAREILGDELAFLSERWSCIEDRERWLLHAIDERCRDRLDDEAGADGDATPAS